MKALVGYSCLVLKAVSMLFNVIPLLGRKLFKVCLACLFKVVIFLNLIEVRFAWETYGKVVYFVELFTKNSYVL